MASNLLHPFAYLEPMVSEPAHGNGLIEGINVGVKH